MFNADDTRKEFSLLWLLCFYVFYFVRDYNCIVCMWRALHSLVRCGKFNLYRKYKKGTTTAQLDGRKYWFSAHLKGQPQEVVMMCIVALECKWKWITKNRVSLTKYIFGCESWKMGSEFDGCVWMRIEQICCCLSLVGSYVRLKCECLFRGPTRFTRDIGSIGNFVRNLVYRWAF